MKVYFSKQAEFYMLDVRDSLPNIDEFEMYYYQAFDIVKAYLSTLFLSIEFNNKMSSFKFSDPCDEAHFIIMSNEGLDIKTSRMKK